MAPIKLFTRDVMLNTKIRLGKILLQSGAITTDDLALALKRQDETGGRLGCALVSAGLITEERMIEALSEQLKIPVIDMALIHPSLDLLRKIPESAARNYVLMPVEQSNGCVHVAMADPLNLAAVDELAAMLLCNIDVSIAAESQIMATIDHYYGVLNYQDKAMRFAFTDPRAYGLQNEIIDNSEDVAPIAGLLEAIIRQATRDRASDIHIEPGEKNLRIRFRIDGVMFDTDSPTKNVESALVSRIKVIANMDISDTRIPQEGRFKMTVDSKKLEFRVSSFPTIYGESVVMRMLEMDSVLMKFEQTGLEGGTMEDFRESVTMRRGMVIVTGPTGSGKTTTLYAALGMINSTDKTIVTIEDPVEYRLKLIRQTQVNPKAGLTFAVGLRSMLRQDPDVIMVGEIRDSETAMIATRAAMTGHLVMSTMHTVDAVGVIERLEDLGVAPGVIASTLSGVLGQRLVRKVCPSCKNEAKTAPAERGYLRAAEKSIAYGRRKCAKCKNSGYFGRIGIFEHLKVDREIKELIASRARPIAIRTYAVKSGLLTTMRTDGQNKVKRRITTKEELDRSYLEE